MTERIRECIRVVVVGVVMAVAPALFGASDARADPPGRVARLSYVAGPVSFSPAGDDQWAEAQLNRPLVAGDRLWADAGGRGELGFGSGSLWLGAATSVAVTNIDDRTAQFELQQGVLDLRVRQMAPGAIVEIDTPNLAFQITRPGRYRLVVDPQGGTTSVLVRSGAGDVYGEAAAYSIGPGQSYGFAGTDLDAADIATVAGIDDFDRFANERDARYSGGQSARYVSPDVVGYEDLDQYGTWQPDSQYGDVWYPREVPSGWTPYRYGQWSWIDPWGWTWVDAAPWGFAPFHYGRWAYTSNRWGWVPGPVNVRPVYAPALVAFVGGSGFSVGVSSGPAIGWFPLAPREVYRPSYNVSRDYYRQVNVSNTVINTTVINNTYVSNFTTTTVPPIARTNYRNLQVPNAVTAVPPAAFAQAQRVDRVAVNMPAATVERAQIQSLARVAPSRKAFTGDAPAARGMPPATTQQRTVIAKSAPPPAATPVAQRVTALERDPGKPVERAAVQPARTVPGPGAPAAGPGSGAAAAAAAAEHNIKVVNPTKAGAGAPPPITQRESRKGREAPGGGQAATPGAPASPATAPGTRAMPATPPVNAAPKARDNEPKGRPPNEMMRPTPGAPPAAMPPNTPMTPPATTPPAPQRADKAAPAPEPPKEPAKGAPSRPASPGAAAPDQPMGAPKGAISPRPVEPTVAPAAPKAAEPREAAPPRAVPQERPRPAPPVAAPPRPVEPAAAPTAQPQPRATPTPPPERAQPQAERPAPARPAPQAQPATPKPPEPAPAPPPRAQPTPPQPAPQAQPAPPPRAQPQPAPQPAPQAQPQPASKAPAAEQPKRNAPREQDKEKDKEKEKEKQG